MYLYGKALEKKIQSLFPFRYYHLNCLPHLYKDTTFTQITIYLIRTPSI